MVRKKIIPRLPPPESPILPARIPRPLYSCPLRVQKTLTFPTSSLQEIALPVPLPSHFSAIRSRTAAYPSSAGGRRNSARKMNCSACESHHRAGIMPLSMMRQTCSVPKSDQPPVIVGLEGSGIVQRTLPKTLSEVEKARYPGAAPESRENYEPRSAQPGATHRNSLRMVFLFT
jgi:hypothetical protein